MPQAMKAMACLNQIRCPTLEDSCSPAIHVAGRNRAAGCPENGERTGQHLRAARIGSFDREKVAGERLKRERVGGDSKPQETELLCPAAPKPGDYIAVACKLCGSSKAAVGFQRWNAKLPLCPIRVKGPASQRKLWRRLSCRIRGKGTWENQGQSE